jgi:hypothetical protein
MCAIVLSSWAETWGGGEKGKGAVWVPVCSRLAGTGEYRNYGGIMDGACCLVV